MAVSLLCKVQKLYIVFFTGVRAGFPLCSRALKKERKERKKRSSMIREIIKELCVRGHGFHFIPRRLFEGRKENKTAGTDSSVHCRSAFKHLFIVLSFLLLSPFIIMCWRAVARSSDFSHRAISRVCLFACRRAVFRCTLSECVLKSLQC